MLVSHRNHPFPMGEDAFIFCRKAGKILIPARYRCSVCPYFSEKEPDGTVACTWEDPEACGKTVEVFDPEREMDRVQKYKSFQEK